MNKETMLITLDLKYFKRSGLVHLATAIQQSEMPGDGRLELYNKIQEYRTRNRETVG